LTTVNSAGTAQEYKSVVQTVIETAPDRNKALAFNYASEALNNSFFLDFLVRWVSLFYACI
jgi:Fe-Mn family superoxide dismutase